MFPLSNSMAKLNSITVTTAMSSWGLLRLVLFTARKEFVTDPMEIVSEMLFFFLIMIGGGWGRQGKGQIWISFTLFPALLLLATLKLLTLSLLLLLLLLLALLTTFAATEAADMTKLIKVKPL